MVTLFSETTALRGSLFSCAEWAVAFERVLAWLADWLVLSVVAEVEAVYLTALVLTLEEVRFSLAVGSIGFAKC